MCELNYGNNCVSDLVYHEFEVTRILSGLFRHNNDTVIGPPPWTLIRLSLVRVVHCDHVLQTLVWKKML